MDPLDGTEERLLRLRKLRAEAEAAESAAAAEKQNEQAAILRREMIEQQRKFEETARTERAKLQFRLLQTQTRAAEQEEQRLKDHVMSNNIVQWLRDCANRAFPQPAPQTRRIVQASPGGLRVVTMPQVIDHNPPQLEDVTNNSNRQELDNTVGSIDDQQFYDTVGTNNDIASISSPPREDEDNDVQVTIDVSQSDDTDNNDGPHIKHRSHIAPNTEDKASHRQSEEEEEEIEDVVRLAVSEEVQPEPSEVLAPEIETFRRTRAAKVIQRCWRRRSTLQQVQARVKTQVLEALGTGQGKDALSFRARARWCFDNDAVATVRVM